MIRKSLFLFLLMVLLVTTSPSLALSIQLVGQSAEASNADPGAAQGASLHWLGAGAMLHDEIVYQFFDSTTLTDQDGDGTVVWQHDYPQATHSIWLAVDISSGEFALASPSDVDSYRREFPAMRLGSELDQLDLPGHDLQILLIRPGQGAWTQRIFDGRNHDADFTADGSLRLDLRDLQSIDGGTGVAVALQVGDRLIAFNPEHFTVAVADVTQIDLDHAGFGGQGGK